jgi:hypothetical protein
MCSSPFDWEMTIFPQMLLVIVGVVMDFATAAEPAPADAAIAVATDQARARLGQPTVDLLSGIARRLRLRLWDIEVIDDDGVPAGWRALSGGLHLRLGQVGQTTDVWVLPDDWIGVCEVGDPASPPTRIVTVTDMRCAVQQGTLSQHFVDTFLVHQVHPTGRWRPVQHTPPYPWTPEQIVHSTARAREMITRLCHDSPCLVAGINSLASLGVPAQPLYQEFALDGDDQVRSAAISALEQLPDATTAHFLGALLNHEKTGVNHDAILRAIVDALRTLRDPASTPDLLTAMDHINHAELLVDVVRTLAELGSREAGPLCPPTEFPDLNPQE